MAPESTSTRKKERKRSRIGKSKRHCTEPAPFRARATRHAARVHTTPIPHHPHTCPPSSTSCSGTLRQPICLAAHTCAWVSWSGSKSVDVTPGAFQPFEPLCSSLQRSLAMIRTIRMILLYYSRLGSLPHHRHSVLIDYLHVCSRASFRCTASLLRPSNRLLSTATRTLSTCIHVFPNRIPAHHTCPHHARARGRWAEARQDVTTSSILTFAPFAHRWCAAPELLIGMRNHHRITCSIRAHIAANASPG